jgi:hypothetical protein
MKNLMLLLLISLSLLSCYDDSKVNNTPEDGIYLGDSEVKAIKIIKETVKTVNNSKYRSYSESDGSVSHEVTVNGINTLGVICVDDRVTHISQVILHFTGSDENRLKIEEVKNKIRQGNETITFLGDNSYSFSEITPISYITFVSVFLPDESVYTLMLNARSKNELNSYKNAFTSLLNKEDFLVF